MINCPYQKVLVVEDERLVRITVAHYLRSAGYVVLEAEGASRAIRICEEDPSIDLVISDVAMPGMNGNELVERLRRYRPEIEVLLMSAFPMRTLLDDGRIASESNVLLKPFTRKQLVETVRLLLRARSS